ncbi:GIY-YIG nuclease family protein [Patescibacteria group bacterium]|nr:GIY-YIG nuclease family protein [Patescibacteria group bacterium]MBU2509139.1 GIY-YIG nuclease family protein [Patescibacteria group bacterium]
MSNQSYRIYTGVTSSLTKRVYEHKKKIISGFTERYNLTRLVYYETTQDVESAIAREKELKGWRREKKINLIESQNPRWKDLSDGWYDD